MFFKFFIYSFGANHDGPTNGCEPLSGDQHVMSPQLSSDAGPIVWSNCSRKDITRFLDRNWGTCLEDPPSDHEFHYPELPPGAMYNVDHQCRLQYGPEAMHCAGMDEVKVKRTKQKWRKMNNKFKDLIILMNEHFMYFAGVSNTLVQTTR